MNKCVYFWLLLTLLVPPVAAEEDRLAGIKAKVRKAFPSVEHVATADFLQHEHQLASQNALVLLDVREPEEFDVSHLAHAQRATDLDEALQRLAGVPKDFPIVAYCSVGYRSSALVEQLQERGYTNVRNIEGSIFEWANREFPLTNSYGETSKVHPYSWWRKSLVEPEHRAWNKASPPQE